MSPDRLKPRADDDEEYDDDEVDPDYVEDLAFDVLAAHVEQPTGTSVLSDLLLDLTTMMARLNVLMAEAEEEDWRGLWPRYHAFLQQVGNLPTGPRARRPVGFAVREKAPKASGGKKKRTGR